MTEAPRRLGGSFFCTYCSAYALGGLPTCSASRLEGPASSMLSDLTLPLLTWVCIVICTTQFGTWFTAFCIFLWWFQGISLSPLLSEVVSCLTAGPVLGFFFQTLTDRAFHKYCQLITFYFLRSHYVSSLWPTLQCREPCMRLCLLWQGGVVQWKAHWFQIQKPGLLAQLPHHLVVLFWVNSLTFLSLCFLICKMGTLLTSKGRCKN